MDRRRLTRRAMQLLFPALGLLACVCPSFAQFTPTEHFTDNANGTVTHQLTGLTWKRCVEGQAWTGSACSGTDTAYTFAQATALRTTFAGKSDWRLPSPWELASIVDYDVQQNPAINTSVFRNAPNAVFWTGMAYTGPTPEGSYFDAWTVSIGTGTLSYMSQFSSARVRMVRGRPMSNPATADFIDNGDGTVTHRLSGLMWKRCAEGMNWGSSTCTSTASTFSALQASAMTSQFAGRSDWRAPTVQELLSIVDFSRTLAPYVNTSIFPRTPHENGFWSATPSGGNAWYTATVNGTTATDATFIGRNVRLVRGTQSHDAHAILTAEADCLFNWAEDTYGAYMQPSRRPSEAIMPFYFRFYSSTNTALGVSASDNHLYFLDPSWNLLALGLASTWSAQAGCR